MHARPLAPPQDNRNRAAATPACHSARCAGAARAPALPQIPALSEFQPGFEASAWIGIAAPRNTPVEIIDKLNKQINAGLADPNIKARLADLGGTPLAGSPADFGKLVADETEKWAKVVKFSGARAE